MTTPINLLIKEILNKNLNSKGQAITELLDLIKHRKQKNIIQDAILYLLEQDHDWENIKKYSLQWKPIKWLESFITRMRIRVNQEEDQPKDKHSTENIFINDQIFQKQFDRLCDKYWRTVSPKRVSKKYEETEIVKISNNPSIKQGILKKTPTNKPIESNKVEESKIMKINSQPSLNVQPESRNINQIGSDNLAQAHETSSNNILRRIKFNRYIPKEQQEEIPLLKTLQTTNIGIVSPKNQTRQKFEKNTLKIKANKSPGKSPVKTSNDFSFSAIRQRQKEPTQNSNHKGNPVFDDFNGVRQNISPSKYFEVKQKIPSAKKISTIQNEGHIDFEFNNEIYKPKSNPKEYQNNLFSTQQQTFIDYSIKPKNLMAQLLNKSETNNFKYFDLLFKK